MLDRYDDQVLALHREGRVLAKTAEGNLGRPIPTCPGWNMADLLVHLGALHGWVAQLLRDRAEEPRRPPKQELPLGTEPIAWYTACLDDLVATLSEVDPDTPMWTVTTKQRAGAWALRQAGETAVHCWDARAAVGDKSEIENAIPYLIEWLGSTAPYTVSFSWPHPA